MNLIIAEREGLRRSQRGFRGKRWSPSLGQELDPKTGRRVEGNKEKDVAIDCEATDLIYRNGWLLCDNLSL